MMSVRLTMPASFRSLPVTGSPVPDLNRSKQKVHMFESDDLVRWRPKGTRTAPPNTVYALTNHGDGMVNAFFISDVGEEAQFLILFRSTPNGKWENSTLQVDAVGSNGTLAYHPRWGYALSWITSPSMQFPRRSQGPYLLRSNTIDAFFRQLE